MKTKLKRAQILNLSKVLEQLKRVQSTRFAYAVARNIRLIDNEVESIRQAGAPPPKQIEYEQKRMALVHKHGAKETDGSLSMESPGNAKIANMPQFMTELAALRTEYADTLADAEKREKDMMSMLSEEVEIEAYEIKAEVLPKDLAADEVYAIMPFLVGDVEAALQKEDK